MAIYTTICLYPEYASPDGAHATYVNSAEADTAREAADKVRQMASDANEGAIPPEDFEPIAVLAGDLALELDHNDFVHASTEPVTVHPQALPEHVVKLLFFGIKLSGSLNSVEVMSFIEEELTQAENNTVEAFLKWCVANKLTFGHGNVAARYQQFLNSDQSSQLG